MDVPDAIVDADADAADAEMDVPDAIVDADADAADAEKKDTWGALLQSCPDDRLLISLPAVLQALPCDARERCFLVFREALLEELRGGVLEGSEVAIAAVCKALQSDTPLALNGEALGNVELCSPSSPHNCTPVALSVYIANVPYDAHEHAIRSFFEGTCNPAKIEAVKFLLNAEGLPKGAVVLTFDCAIGVERARALDGKPGLDGRILMVREDKRAADNATCGKARGKGRLKRESVVAGVGGERQQKTQSSENAHRSVIVKNLAFDASDIHLGVLFAGCGEITATRLARDRRSGRSKGFAVVEFADRAGQALALKLDGRLVRGRPVRVELLIGSDASITEDVSPGEAKHIEEEGDVAAPDDVSKLDVSEGATLNELGSMESHTKKLKAEASDMIHGLPDVAECPPKKRSRHEKLACAAALDLAKHAFPSGEDGLRSAVALAIQYETPEGLVAAESGDALKARLAALGLKAGGSPIERAKRILQLRDVKSVDNIPKELLAKPAKRAEMEQG